MITDATVRIINSQGQEATAAFSSISPVFLDRLTGEILPGNNDIVHNIAISSFYSVKYIVTIYDELSGESQMFDINLLRNLKYTISNKVGKIKREVSFTDNAGNLEFKIKNNELFKVKYNIMFVTS